MELVDHLDAALTHLHAARSLTTGDVATDVAAAMGRVQEVTRLVQAIGLDLTAAADVADTAHGQGAVSTQAWLAQTAGVSHREAAKDVRLATELQALAPQTRHAMTLPGMST